MQYRRFEKVGFEVSALAFGAMRLPEKDGKIDESEAIRMIRHAVDKGVNYVDTAYPYHGGQSEVLVGKALAGGYREKVKLATKLPVWEVKTAADFDRLLDIQLKRLGLPFVDVYLIHALDKGRWEKMRALGILDWAEKARASGRFRHLGFSFHDGYDTFKEIVDAYDWAMCQVQYNYMDVDRQAGMQGVRYAGSKGIPVVVMEPLLGGKLVNPPRPVQDLWDSAAVKRSPAGWALHWLWDQPEVTTVLSGMSTMAQVEENVALASTARVGALSADEMALVDRARVTYRDLIAIPCTACRYCMPCPNNVDIPRMFSIYNDGIAFEKPDWSRHEYAWLEHAFKSGIEAKDVRAASCVQCHKCEEECPQHITIADWMTVIDGALGKGKPLVKKL